MTNITSKLRHLSRFSRLIVHETKQIYSLNVFYFLLYRLRYFLIQKPRFQRNNIIARYRKSDLHGMSFQSSPKINRMLIPRLILHAVKVYDTRPSQFCYFRFLFFFRPLSSVQLLQSNQCFQAIEIVGRHVSEKL